MLRELIEGLSQEQKLEQVPRVFSLDGAGGYRPTLPTEPAKLIGDAQPPRVWTAKR